MERFVGEIGRRWRWVVVGAVVGALLGVGSTFTRSDAWVADSLVVLTDARIPPEEFSDVAVAIFPTDAVLGTVVDDLGVDETPGSLISSGALRVQPAPGGLAVRVVARTQEEGLSVALANAAAAALAEVGEKNGLGDMAQFPVQDARSEKDPLVASTLAGAIIGAAVAIGAIGVRSMLRRGGGTDVERAGADVTLWVRVAPAAGGRTSVEVEPPAALRGLWEGFLDASSDGGSITGLRLDDGPSGWAVLGVAAELDRLASKGGGGRGIEWTSASQPVPDDASDRIAVVAPADAGRRLADVRHMLDDARPGAFVALVVVSAPDLA